VSPGIEFVFEFAHRVHPFPFSRYGFERIRFQRGQNFGGEELVAQDDENHKLGALIEGFDVIDSGIFFRGEGGGIASVRARVLIAGLAAAAAFRLVVMCHKQIIAQAFYNGARGKCRDWQARRTCCWRSNDYPEAKQI
jgi:hypothetical protein